MVVQLPVIIMWQVILRLKMLVSLDMIPLFDLRLERHSNAASDVISHLTV